MVLITLALATGLLAAIPISDTRVPLILGLLCIAGLLVSRKSVWILGWFMLSISISGWIMHAHRLNRIQVLDRRVAILNEKEVAFKGRVLSRENREKGWRYCLINDRVALEQMVFEERFQYYVYDDENAPIPVGAMLEGRGQFRSLMGVRNPGEFDYRTYYLRKGIYGRIFASGNLQSVPPTRWNWRPWMEGTREWIRTTFNKVTDPGTAGLLSALILGDKTRIDSQLRDTFVDTGVVHVLAVSGLHVGYVLAMLTILVKFLRFPWGWDRLAILVGLGLFCLLTGGKASVVRAALMAGLYTLAPVLDRPVNGWNIIATAGCFLLFLDPASIGDAGFQLSFSAVTGIVYLYPRFDRYFLSKHQGSGRLGKVMQFIRGLFLVSLAAQIGTLPFIVWTFGRIPLIALFANVVIVPVVGVLVALGFSILFLGWLPVLGLALGESAWLATTFIRKTAEYFSSFPMGTVFVAGDQRAEWIVAGIGLAGTLLLMARYRKRIFLYTGMTISLGFLLYRICQPGTLDVIFMDVGQGDAAILRFPNGKTMLVDAGYRDPRVDMGERVVIPTARYLGIQRFNWVVLSHPHNDHIGGLIRVAEELPVDTVWDSYVKYGSWTYRHLLETFREQGVVYHRPHRGDEISVDMGIQIRIFAPDSSFSLGQRNVNNASIVFKVSYGKTSFLFTGDLEKKGDEVILPFGPDLDSRILKVAHHGSITSSTEALLELVTPEIAVVSVGRRNKFGHPSDQVLERLQRFGAEIRRTDREGAIWFRSNGKKVWTVKWRS